MSSVRLVFSLLALVILGVALAGCQSQTEKAEGFQWKPLFGNGLHDTSPVLAVVGDIEITQQDLDLRFDELPKEKKKDYQGEEGQRLLLKDMVEQVLLVKGAIDKKLYNDTDVARSLISQRRSILDSAMRNYGLLRGNEPTDAEVKAYFDNNRDQFRQQAITRARHVECLSRAEADKAYARLVEGGPRNDFPHVVKDFTKNVVTAKDDGELGWFNPGGFIPGLTDAKAFTLHASELELGLHPPFKIGDRWHVVEVTRKEYERPMTFQEAKDQVLRAVMPGHQDRIIKDYLRQARKDTPVEFRGKFAPGQGMSPEQLFARGMALADPIKKMEMFTLVFTDFPESDRADDALFMCGLVALETYQDRRIAAYYMDRIGEEYPDSEYMENVRFLEENNYNPSALNPGSIEELKKD
jgi:peptidyl-prolyl cis-trans isomerase C